MADAFTSLREIAQLNIEHYSRLLRTPLDERTRRIVEKLLADEKAKLANLQEARHSTAVEPAGITRRWASLRDGTGAWNGGHEKGE